MLPDDLRARAESWYADDPDPVTRAELRALLAHPDLASTDLADRFSSGLEFGTAGLRGILGAGPNRMNRAVVARATWGLAHELLARVPDAVARGVVVGADARRMSRELCEDAAAILAAAGLRVVLFPGPVPTPLVGFAVKRLGAAGGAVITASHNPPEYSGCKVYWENAAQIVAPVDAAIAAAIVGAPPARSVERPPLDELRRRGLVVSAPAEMEDAYLDAIAALSVHPTAGDRRLPIVYTPLHGVGDSLARRALARAGFSNVTSVPEQQRPDGAFPTVAFPNPEEPGAMDMALALGKKVGAELVLANDPDADRLAVAVRDDDEPTGYMVLSGNETGVLLGSYLLREGRPAARPRAVLSTIVSSPLLGRIASSWGVHYEETLTGFKWIAKRAIELERDGFELVFGYEEALGYCVGSAVHDKDGISAALLTAEVVSVLRERGRTVVGELEAIALAFGAYASLQRSLIRNGAMAIDVMMGRLRGAPPHEIGGDPVLFIADYGAGVRSDVRRETSAPLGLPESNVIAFELASGGRVVARPSGTEPKAKFYFDVREEVRSGESARQALVRAKVSVGRLADAFMTLLIG